MKGRSVRFRLAVAAVAALVVFLYLVIVDLGVSAGRIHHGVTVEGIDVSGLTEGDALRKLNDLADEIASTPVVFTAEGINLHFIPRELGWGFRPATTARRAMDVGRSGGVFSSLGERIEAWVSGVEVKWAGKFFDGAPARKAIDDVQAQAVALGYDFSRHEMRAAIKRAIRDWPRRGVYEIPVGEG